MESNESRTESTDSVVQYEAYLTERRFWRESNHQAISALSRSLVTLSSAGIGLTIALITQDFVPKSIAEIVSLLGAWIGYLGVILLVHRAYEHSQRTARASIDEEDAQYQNLFDRLDQASTEREESDKKHSRTLKYAQWCFYAAVLFTLFFVGIQIS